VRERLPDDVLLSADEIELVDMSPHALRQRMRHGNVYPPERTEIALERFFTEANLTALREMALRIAAQRVEGQLEASTAGGQLLLVTERVLVLVDASPAAPRTVRRAAHLASALHGALTAVVVEIAGAGRPAPEQERHQHEAIDDAVDLGAEILRVEAPDLVAALVRAARLKRATHLFIPRQPIRGLQRITQRPITDQILAQLPDLEVHLVDVPAGARPGR
jgi:two-component system sensor histidine kinase KdpD